MSIIVIGHEHVDWGSPVQREYYFFDYVRSNNKVVSVFINVGVSGGTPPSILNTFAAIVDLSRFNNSCLRLLKISDDNNE
jgi:hypothetical protein